MKKTINDIKYQTCNICDALVRNINDNFKSVSFDFLKNGDVLVKIILEKRTKVEEDYVEDMIAELSAVQISDCIKRPLIEVGDNRFPLQYLVYQKSM